jgi:enoyl-[acyl-carrier protein] reductase II
MQDGLASPFHTPSPALSALWAGGCTFLGTPTAILGGAMTWVSERTLVSAISEAGGFGILASGSMSPKMLRAEIQATKALTGKPFGVNLIVMHPDLTALAAVCLAEGVSHIVLAGGIPPTETVRQIKDGGAKVVAFGPTYAFARKLVRGGVDALIIEGSEAGGHIGAVSTSVLAQEILPLVRDVPVFVAGGIGRGEAMLAYLEMGAAGVQLGTRFVCATESVAHPNFKQAFIRATAREAQPSVQLDPRFPVIPVRALINQATRAFQERQRQVISAVDAGILDQKQAQLDIEHFWSGALRRAVVEGDVQNGSLMAGQSVGFVNKEQATAEIIADLITQANCALRLRALARAVGG